MGSIKINKVNLFLNRPKNSQMLPSSNAEVEKSLGKTLYAVEHEQVAKVTPRKLQPLNTSSTKNNPHPLKVVLA